jgi:uncharacterized protein (TIGR00299 family) protein
LTALFYQPSCGISGDMHLAALVDLGVPTDWLRGELNKLSMHSEFDIRFERQQKMGISGTHAKVVAEDRHDHRHHSTIIDIITAARFSPGVESIALRIFDLIAQAEGKIHDIPPEKVHFHEVGAVDSIVDIVAAALCIDYLQPDMILCNPIEVGSGFVDCAHGRFPVPAPATQELLKAAPCTYGGVEGESTTPTGAAILAAVVDEFSPTGVFSPQRIGYGVGFKDFSRPNVLRVAIGEYSRSEVATPQDLDTHYKLEANIDDMSPEAYEPLMQALFDSGASDVYLVPIIMKKSRPAHTLVVLADAQHRDMLADQILNLSSTIGLRSVPFAKRVLPRESRTIATAYGEVLIKLVQQPNGHTRWKLEHDDVIRLAHEHACDYAQMRAKLEHAVRGQEPFE